MKLLSSRRARAAVAALAVGGLAVGAVTQVIPAGATHTTIRANLVTKEGLPSGTVTFTQLRYGVRVQVNATNLYPAFHGIHIHQVGRCEGDFTSAGPHLNPTGSRHGDHAGDLPNILVIHNVGARAVMETDGFTVNDLFDGDGSAVIVHEGTDNHGNIPGRYGAVDAATTGTGDSGGRHLCGVVRRG